jgi:hypothetical protein
VPSVCRASTRRSGGFCGVWWLSLPVPRLPENVLQAVCPEASPTHAHWRSPLQLHLPRLRAALRGARKPQGVHFVLSHYHSLTVLQRHTRVHTGEKPFQCEHPGCGHRFARMGHLLQHRKTQHRFFPVNDGTNAAVDPLGAPTSLPSDSVSGSSMSDAPPPAPAAVATAAAVAAPGPDATPDAATPVTAAAPPATALAGGRATEESRAVAGGIQDAAPRAPDPVNATAQEVPDPVPPVPSPKSM